MREEREPERERRGGRASRAESRIQTLQSRLQMSLQSPRRLLFPNPASRSTFESEVLSRYMYGPRCSNKVFKQYACMYVVALQTLLYIATPVR
jgi:hypothetical protein